jgi:hypothetical protein
MAPIQKYVQALQTTYHVKCRCPFLSRFYQKYPKTKPYVAFYPLKAVLARPADVMAVIKTLVNAPRILHVVILWKKPHIRIVITLNRMKHRTLLSRLSGLDRKPIGFLQ